MRILVVEDYMPLLETISRRLATMGYSVDKACDGMEALDFILLTNYDLIILDIMIPHMDGFTLIRIVREKGIHTPILCLTAKDSIEDKVMGLDMGADDYIVKPFSFDELLARVRALLRRQTISTSPVLKVKDLVMDINSRKVFRNGKEIELTSKEFALLEYLVKNKGKILTRSQIAEHIWNYDFEGTSNIVDVYIRYLRRKIDDDYDEKLIYTVRGIGYTLKDDNK